MDKLPNYQNTVLSKLPGGNPNQVGGGVFGKNNSIPNMNKVASARDRRLAEREAQRRQAKQSKLKANASD